MLRLAASMTRRNALAQLAGASAALAAAGRGRATTQRVQAAMDVIVVGAGVFGAWTAWQLLRRGQRVLLLDAHGAAHSRASSGGESRLTRSIYGADAVYTKMDAESLADWRWLSARAGLPILHAAGILMYFQRQEPFAQASIATHRELGLPLHVVERAELARRWPQADWEGIEFGLHQPDYGVLMARRAVQTLVAEFVAAGGEYRVAAVTPPVAGASRLESVKTSAGNAGGEQFVFACGPWLPKLFPQNAIRSFGCGCPLTRATGSPAWQHRHNITGETPDLASMSVALREMRQPSWGERLCLMWRKQPQKNPPKSVVRSTKRVMFKRGSMG